MVEDSMNEQDSDKNNISIFYKGLESTNLAMKERIRFQDIVEEYAEKLQWHVNNQCEIEVHIKEFEKTGDRHRYEVNCKFTFPGDTVTSKSDEWEAIAAVRDALDGLNHQLENKFKEVSSKDRASTAEFLEQHER
ncbi:MAG: HPF/RaiA family ribosome-associated protein [Nanobdellota archaeon]